MMDSAMDQIDSRYKVFLDRKRARILKMKYKGSPSSVVIRMDKTDDDDTETSKSRDGCSPNTVNKKQTEKLDTTKKDVIEEPHYTIVHRGYIDYQDYTTARDSVPDTRPRELVVTVELPHCESTAGISLDVLENHLNLESKKQKYSLSLALPFPVDSNKGKATFDKSKRRLTIVLNVLPARATRETEAVAFNGKNVACR
jgi:dynein assembly factor 2